MAILNPLELTRLKSLLSGKVLTTEEQINTLDLLRSRFSNFFSSLEPNLTEEKLKDNKFLIKYLSNPYNRNKIKNALRSELSLPADQQIALEQALSEKPVAAEEAGGQSTNQEATPATGQETQPAGAAGSSAVNMPFGGMSSVPSFSSSPRVFATQQTPPVGGMEGGTGQGTAATNKAGRSFNFSSFRSKVGSKITGAARTGLEKANPFLKQMGTGGINALSGMANFGGGQGGIFSSLGRFGKGGGRDSSLVSKAKGRGGLIFAGALIGAMFLVGAMAAFAPNPTPGQTAPISNTSGLDYTLPLKSTSVQPLDIKNQVTAAFPGAKLEYWDKIVQSSIAAGFNPALALALWIEETGASHTTLARNGGSEIPVNGNLTKGHLGCAPTQDQAIDESLSCLFKFMATYNFTNDQFADFMAKYSGGPTNAPFSNNPNFPKNLKEWYSKLVPSGAGAIVAVTPSPMPQQAIASCPVAEGRISTPSYNASPNTGHCGGSYASSCHCGTTGRRAKAIDVPTNGQSVVLPTVNGQSVNWKLIEGPYQVEIGEGGGQGYTFQANQGNDTWYLDMLHLNTSSLARNTEYPSGTPVAKSAITHVHMTIGRNLSSRPIAGTATDCDPNWLPSDFLCQ